MYLKTATDSMAARGHNTPEEAERYGNNHEDIFGESRIDKLLREERLAEFTPPPGYKLVDGAHCRWCVFGMGDHGACTALSFECPLIGSGKILAEA